ncbi:MAG: leucyl aminopeptidase family protein [Bacteroidetes bacterium]|nr:leucyl aminopeptidase family protein [Bacteroidota bacterium]
MEFENPEKKRVEINRFSYRIYVLRVEKNNKNHETKESIRKAGYALLGRLNEYKTEKITIVDRTGISDFVFAFSEGMALGTYRFLRYKSEKDKNTCHLKEIEIISEKVTVKDIERLSVCVKANFITRDLINEPSNYLTATRLAHEFERMGKEAGFSVEVFNKSKIREMKMGGILAVNRGSPEPPTFTVMTWKPANAKNKKPIVLIGKGIVFDTGGLSLKPTKDSMDSMKSDMSGGAAAGGVLYAAARNRLPVYLIGLVPATDNRPGGDAYAPGDIITMYDGTTVEVLNTDAEGRLVLADALAFAKELNPELVIDLATLTGAARSAVGPYAAIGMGTAGTATSRKLVQTGFDVFERVVEVPFWDEYFEQMKSDVADLKNIGSGSAGHITAGKFLEHFTKEKEKHAYPWIHLDIAPVAFLEKKDSYRGKGGSGFGVRLLFEFLRKL